MKSLAVLAAMLMTGTVAHLAFGADTAERPPGVEARHWIPAGDRLGFVIVPEEGQPKALPPGGGGHLIPAAEGYFMAKTAAGWRRLVIIEPVKGRGAAG
jgi:hypothetical protein